MLPDGPPRGLLGDHWAKRGTIYSGTLTPETSLMDFNGYRNNGRKLGWAFASCGGLEGKGKTFREFETFEAFTKATGMERQGVWGIDFGDFIRANTCGETGTPIEENDLRLREGSKAIDAGKAVTQLTDGFAGKGPDMGAYESGRPIPQYGPRPR